MDEANEPVGKWWIVVDMECQDMGSGVERREIKVHCPCPLYYRSYLTITEMDTDWFQIPWKYRRDTPVVDSPPYDARSLILIAAAKLDTDYYWYRILNIRFQDDSGKDISDFVKTKVHRDYLANVMDESVRGTARQIIDSYILESGHLSKLVEDGLFFNCNVAADCRVGFSRKHREVNVTVKLEELDTESVLDLRPNWSLYFYSWLTPTSASTLPAISQNSRLQSSILKEAQKVIKETHRDVKLVLFLRVMTGHRYLNKSGEDITDYVRRCAYRDTAISSLDS